MAWAASEVLYDCTLARGDLNLEPEHLKRLVKLYWTGDLSKRQIDAAYGKSSSGGKFITRQWKQAGIKA
jgi:hypothetical protein